jgi:hypothetical protein
MGFNIHILSGRNRSTNLAGHAALAASFNPPRESTSGAFGIILGRLRPAILANTGLPPNLAKSDFFANPDRCAA